MLGGVGSEKLVVKPGSKPTKTSITGKLRSEPFGQLVCAYAEGMSPLIAAMTFASAPVVTNKDPPEGPMSPSTITALPLGPDPGSGAGTNELPPLLHDVAQTANAATSIALLLGGLIS